MKLRNILFVTTCALLLTGCSSHTQAPCYYVCPDQTPTPVTAPRKQKVAARKPAPLPKTVIALDAGHGGKDFGAQSLDKPTYSEKNFNLTTVRMVETFLKKKNVRTSLIRDDDTFYTLDERVAMTEDAKADLFVSVHYNAAPSRKAQGIEVYYYDDGDSDVRTQESKALAKAVLDRVITATGAKSRGIKHGNYAVIRKNKVPAILVEGGFLSNSEELEKLKDPAYLKKVSWGITQGIEDYLKTKAQ